MYTAGKSRIDLTPGIRFSGFNFCFKDLIIARLAEPWRRCKNSFPNFLRFWEVHLGATRGVYGSMTAGIKPGCLLRRAL
jgi:hypothetical protein